MNTLFVTVLAATLYSVCCTQCGYKSCNPVKDGMINVHLVPHTHDDVGWLKTVDQYFYGARNDIQNAGVQYVLDSVIPELLADPTKRFIYVEIAFFSRWWNEQDDAMKEQVRGLVNKGSLEFILGGWCMNDEASTHYQAIIDQHTLGFDFLKKNFGSCGRPRVAWQIDPFGHSREQASLFAQMGFDGLFFGRLDYQDKNNRLNHSTMEMMWHGSANLGEKADLFTGALYNGYGPPDGFNWDQFSKDAPIMDDKNLHDYNVDERISDFVKAVHDQAKHFATNHIVMTMGSDFEYQNANHWYKNMDKLIKYTNQLQDAKGSKINVLYSTPSCYLYQLNRANKTWTTKSDDFYPYVVRAHGVMNGFYTSRPTLKFYVRQSNSFLQQATNGSKINVLYSTPSCYLYQLNKADKTWTTKSDDFFPYADKAHSFWTGYFTSRAALKGYVRKTSSFLQACKQLTALAKMDGPKVEAKVNVLKEAMGVAQHHDAVSGTEKQAVAYDYALRLARGVAMCEDVVAESYSPLLQKDQSVPLPEQHFCNLLNISDCRITETSKQFTMVVYNPLARQREHWMRLPVVGKAYSIIGPDGKLVQSQIIPITNVTNRIPERNGSMAVNELVFQISVPALGVSTYFISLSNSRVLKKQQMSVIRKIKGGADFHISNKHISLRFDGKTGKVKKLINLASGVDMDIGQDITFYYGYQGNGSKDIFQASGAYIFRPNNTEPYQWPNPHDGIQLVGPLVDEVYMYYSPWVSQVFRVYKDAKHAEIEWTVGPIPIQDKAGKEVIARFDTELKTEELFYTDANGREILQRKRNYRPTWNLNQTEPVAGNYYPVNSRIYIQDKAANKQLTMLTDRSLGGGSINDGQMEIMLHRRLLYDDHFGVGEPLNETGSDGQGLIVRGKLFMLFDTIENSAKLHRDLAQKIFYQPVPSFAVTEKKYPDYTGYYKTSWSGMKTALPENVNLVTLEVLEPSAQQNLTYLIRLEHIYEKNEDPVLSKPVSVQIENLFQPLTILNLEELILGANLPLSELERLQWKTTDDSVQKDDTLYYKSVYQKSSRRYRDIPNVILNPMEIRTFHATVNQRNPNYKH